MFTESAELYDLIYGSFKNYADEAVLVTEWMERYRPGVRSVLDVACGTGEHARHLVARGFDVVGVDLNETFIEIARDKVPAALFVPADMTTFSLGRKFDAVLCLFSSIGYVRTLDNVDKAMSRFAEHLDDNGVLIVEPWFTPEQWRVGFAHHQSASNDSTTVSRMSYSGAQGTISTIEFQYLIGRQGAGIEHRTEVHELGMFTKDEMLGAFERAGLDVVYDEQGIAGRGLYVGRHRRVC